MQHLYFHQIDDGLFIEDLEGFDFQSLDQARAVAIEDARELIAEMAKTGRLDLCRSFQIANETGRVLLTMPFSEAVEIVHGKPTEEARQE